MLSGAPVSSTLRADQLLDQFLQGSDRQARTLVKSLRQKVCDLAPLIAEHLGTADRAVDSWRCGYLFQLLAGSSAQGGSGAWPNPVPEDWLTAPSAMALDYGPLQGHLLRQEFEAADRLTSTHLRQLAGPAAEQRGYVYFSEVAPMPALDLESLDRLWLTYSLGRFGFSVQGQILRRCQGRWDSPLAPARLERERPLDALPLGLHLVFGGARGPLPLINQLRGVRLMDALLQHPAVLRRTEAALRAAKG